MYLSFVGSFAYVTGSAAVQVRVARHTHLVAVEVRGRLVRDQVDLHGLLEQELLVAARTGVFLLAFMDAVSIYIMDRLCSRLRSLQIIIYIHQL